MRKNIKNTIQIIFGKIPYEATICDEGIQVKDLSTDSLFTYVEQSGIYGLFAEDTRCCNSWRFAPTLEDICKSIKDIQTKRTYLSAT